MTEEMVEQIKSWLSLPFDITITITKTGDEIVVTRHSIPVERLEDKS